MKILVTSPIGIKGVHTPAGSIVDLPEHLAREIVHAGTAVEHIQSELVEKVAPIVSPTEETAEAEPAKAGRKKG